jgi:hypothetical protein
VDVVLNSDSTVFVAALRDGPGPDPTVRGLLQPTATHPGPVVDANQILVSYSGREAAFVGPQATLLHDFLAGETHTLPVGSVGGAGWSAYARFLALATADATLVPGDTNGVADIVVIDLPRYFDADLDGLDDRWERLSGLDPGSGLGDDGPLGDPDGDGLTNLQELATASENLPPGAWQHPRGMVHRYAAEGAENDFFRTRLALANPDPTHAAAVVIRYHQFGFAVTQALRIPPRGRRTSLPSHLVALRGAGSFAIEIESDRPVVADREMSWDATGYGASVETLRQPAATWYFAEGTTAADFALFYLLHNPQATAVNATIRYLRPSGPVIEHPVFLPAHSRTTIEVGRFEPTLRGTDVSAEIRADAPIVVERAMYASRHGQPFALGHAAAGARAPAASWFLAEGATGSFFDLFVLIANPGPTPATVALDFLRPDGVTITRTLIVPANARRSVYVDAIDGLQATAVSTRVTADVPVVVERAMYWPGGFFDYQEGHASSGSTGTATRWVLAQGDDGGPRDAQSFVLIANVGSTTGEARLTLLGERGPGASEIVTLPANSRVTVRVGAGRTDPFGVLVESLGASAAPIVVEGAYYWSPGGHLWAAGANVLATPLP